MGSARAIEDVKYKAKNMNTEDKFNQLYSIAKLYYEEKMSQDEIAAIFNISRATVSRCLVEAEKKNIVQIKVVDLLGLSRGFEEKLEKKYDLKKAVVAFAPYKDSEIIRRSIGMEAANFLNSFIKDNQSIGLAWGATLQEIVKSLQPKSIKNLNIVELIGNMGRIANKYDVSEIARRFATNFNAKRFVLQAPGLVSSTVIKKALLSEKNIIDVMNMGKKADIVIVGIGAVDYRSQIYKTLNFSKKDLTEILTSNAIGDICFRFFSGEGMERKFSFDDRIVGIDLTDFKKIPLRIGIAGGENKVAPIRGALLGSYINILITDNYTSQHLV